MNRSHLFNLQVNYSGRKKKLSGHAKRRKDMQYLKFVLIKIPEIIAC